MSYQTPFQHLRVGQVANVYGLNSNNLEMVKGKQNSKTNQNWWLNKMA